MVCLECTLAVICPHYHLWEKEVILHDVFGLYSFSNLPILVSTIIAIIPHLGKVRNVGGAAGMRGRHQWVVDVSQGWGSNEEEKGDECEPKPVPSFIKAQVAFEILKLCPHNASWFTWIHSRMRADVSWLSHVTNHNSLQSSACRIFPVFVDLCSGIYVMWLALNICTWIHMNQLASCTCMQLESLFYSHNIVECGEQYILNWRCFIWNIMFLLYIWQ